MNNFRILANGVLGVLRKMQRGLGCKVTVVKREQVVLQASHPTSPKAGLLCYRHLYNRLLLDDFIGERPLLLNESFK